MMFRSEITKAWCGGVKMPKTGRDWPHQVQHKINNKTVKINLHFLKWIYNQEWS